MARLGMRKAARSEAILTIWNGLIGWKEMWRGEAEVGGGKGEGKKEGKKALSHNEKI